METHAWLQPIGGIMDSNKYEICRAHDSHHQLAGFEFTPAYTGNYDHHDPLWTELRLQIECNRLR